MSLQTPLGRVRGLGSAKEGTRHWWLQRLTAVALVPLSVWMVVVAVQLIGADYATAHAFVANPVATVAALLLIGALFYHVQLGLQVVIEDYVHVEWLKLTSLIAIKFVVIFLGVAAAVAVVRISLD